MTDILKSQTTIQPSTESLLAQIRIVEENITRLRVLVETGMHVMPTNVPQYCILKAQKQLENILEEINLIK